MKSTLSFICRLFLFLYGCHAVLFFYVVFPPQKSLFQAKYSPKIRLYLTFSGLRKALNYYYGRVLDNTSVSVWYPELNRKTPWESSPGRNWMGISLQLNRTHIPINGAIPYFVLGTTCLFRFTPSGSFLVCFCEVTPSCSCTVHFGDLSAIKDKQQ